MRKLLQEEEFQNNWSAIQPDNFGSEVEKLTEMLPNQEIKIVDCLEKFITLFELLESKLHQIREDKAQLLQERFLKIIISYRRVFDLLCQELKTFCLDMKKDGEINLYISLINVCKVSVEKNLQIYQIKGENLFNAVKIVKENKPLPKQGLGAMHSLMVSGLSFLTGVNILANYKTSNVNQILWRQICIMTIYAMYVVCSRKQSTRSINPVDPQTLLAQCHLTLSNLLQKKKLLKKLIAATKLVTKDSEKSFVY